MAITHAFKGILESSRGDPAGARAAAEVLIDVSEEHALEFFLAVGRVFSSWARARLLGSQASSAELERALSDYMAAGNRMGAPLFLGLLAEVEAAMGNPDRALGQIGEGLTIAEETGERYTDSFLHRVRGDILLRRDPLNPAPAEDAYRTAIGIAKEQDARSYGLHAALSLAKLYQSTARPAEAQAVLAPAFEGFSPTPEMPEIAEAQALLPRLA